MISTYQLWKWKAFKNAWHIRRKQSVYAYNEAARDRKNVAKDSAAVRKSSRMWIICGMLSLLRATHSKAVLSFSNVLHELASPVGKKAAIYKMVTILVHT